MQVDPPSKKTVDSKVASKLATAKKLTSGSLSAQDMTQADILKWVAIGIGVVALVVINLNSLWPVALNWKNPQYSHGYLIPLFAAVLLWIRREPFQSPSTSHIWCGVGLLALAVLLRVIGTRYVMFTIDNLSFIPCVLSVFIIIGGFAAMRWAAAPICFLAFMYPLPGFLGDRILRPLQTFATEASTIALQTLGVEAYRVGNNIKLDHMDLGVIDQCSGLRMLTIFIALSTAIAMILTHRPMWERLVLVASAVPIAILVNVIRITVTGLLYNLKFNSDVANHLFHDWAGFFMMPIALGLLFLVMQILSRLMVETSQVPVVAVSRSAPRRSNVKRPMGAGPVAGPGKTG